MVSWKFRETFGILEKVQKMNQSEQQLELEVDEAVGFMATAYMLLRAALGSVLANPHADQFMEHRNKELGITKNRQTFSEQTITRGHYQQVGPTSGDEKPDSKQLAIYKVSKHLGFGLLDDTMPAILPLDINEVIAEISADDANPITQRFRVEMILSELEQLARPES